MGAYDLASVDKRVLPVLRMATIECDYTVVDGGLSIGPANEIVILVQEHADCTRGGGTSVVQGRGYYGTYVQSGAALTVVVTDSARPSVRIEATIEGGGRVVALPDRLSYAAGPGLLRFSR
jgi:hypothetical protein